MAIPKILYQTYSSWGKLPITTKFMISRMKRFFRAYRYEFYDDQRIDDFISAEYGSSLFKTYKKKTLLCTVLIIMPTSVKVEVHFLTAM